MTDIPWIQTQGESFTFVPKLQDFLQRVLEAEVKHRRKSFTKILRIYSGQWQNNLANYQLLARVIINISYPPAGIVLFSNLFLWHLSITLIMSDTIMLILPSILPLSELKIDTVPSPLTAMNYSVCFLLSTSLILPALFICAWVTGSSATK